MDDYTRLLAAMLPTPSQPEPMTIIVAPDEMVDDVRRLVGRIRAAGYSVEVVDPTRENVAELTGRPPVVLVDGSSISAAHAILARGTGGNIRVGPPPMGLKVSPRRAWIDGVEYERRLAREKRDRAKMVNRELNRRGRK